MQPPASKTHLPSIVQLLVSGFGLMIFGASAAGLFVTGVVGLMGSGFSRMDVFPLFSMAWTALAVSLLLLPSLYSALLRLMGREDRWRGIRNGFRVASVLLLAWPLLVALGELLSRNDQVAILLVPPLQVLAIAIPLWWLIEFGRRGLGVDHPQRSWAVMSVGLVVTPTLIIIIEVVLLILAAGGAIFWLSTQPQLVEELNRAAQRLVNSNLDTETTFRILRPYLQQPLVLYAIFAMVSGFIPLIEELFKPVALWGLVSPRFTPADGFVTGMICGAAFALIESLGMLGTAAAGGEWASAVTGRVGTGLLHTVTAGMVGWGLASAWSRGRYLRLAGIFFLAFLLHGIWNIFGILLGIAPAVEGQTGVLAVLERLSAVAPYALGVLALILFLILVGANRRLRRETALVSNL